MSQLQSALENVLEQYVTFEQSQSVMNNFSNQKPGKATWKAPKDNFFIACIFINIFILCTGLIDISEFIIMMVRS